MIKTTSRQTIAKLWERLEKGEAAQVLEQLGQPTKEAPLVERTLRALALYETGRHDEAIPAFESILAEEPEDPVAQLFLVLALFKSGNRKAAGERLLHKTIIHPHRFWLEDFLRTFWPLRFTSTLDDPDPLPPESEWKDPFASAYSKWKAGSETKEEHGRPRLGTRRLSERYVAQAESRYLAKDLAQALRLMERAHEILPTDENTVTNLSYLYLLTGRRDQAIALLDPEMKRRLERYEEKKDPSDLPHMELLVCYAWAVHEQGNHEQALRLLSAVNPEGPEDLGAHFVAAVCWLMLGREMEFRQAFGVAMDKYFIDTWEQLLVPFIHRVGAWLEREG